MSSSGISTMEAWGAGERSAGMSKRTAPDGPAPLVWAPVWSDATKVEPWAPGGGAWPATGAGAAVVVGIAGLGPAYFRRRGHCGSSALCAAPQPAHIGGWGHVAPWTASLAHLTQLRRWFRVKCAAAHCMHRGGFLHPEALWLTPQHLVHCRNGWAGV